MPNILGVLVLAATLPTFQNIRPGTPPHLIARTRGGATIEVDAPPVTNGLRSFIVQFQEPPLLARRRNGIATQSVTSYRETFDRFRRDIATRAARGKSTESAGGVTHEYYRAFNGVSVVLDEAGADAARRLPYVRRVSEDTPVKAYASEDGTRLARIGAERVWSELNVRGDGIVVAVIDTGVDYKHSALGGGIGPGFKVVGGFDFVDGDEDPMDEHGHGTHVAGIIAGDDAEVHGVAPHVHLLAYRVLNRYGEGSSSDIIMAIERTVDPNQDGDVSDHADVANLSLGGPGDADSPTSLAIDTATQAGVVFSLSAGNTGGEVTIGAPAAARLAITVGASESDDALALYSSRGPSSPDWTLKPEVVAPGSLIRSARLGGGTLVASGTSMAAPHVAGAAALLLQLHPDWTPADVKAALVGSASPIEAAVIAQGGGRIDVYRAATFGDAIAPAVVTFGRHARSGGWTSTRTVRVTNQQATEQTFTGSFATPANITIAAEPSTFTLAAGAAQDVVLNATISAEAGVALASFAHGGRVTFTSAAGAVQVPWVAIEGAHVVITHQLFSSVLWSCDRGPGMASIGFPDYTHDLLLPQGRCDLLAYSQADEGGGGTLILQSRTIDDDAEIALTIQDAPHEVRMAGVDRNGTPIAREGYSETAPYLASYDFTFPPSSMFQTLGFTQFAPMLHLSDVGEGFTLTSSEVFFDLPNHSIYSIHHPPLHGVRASATLATLPSDLHQAHLNVAPQREGAALLPMFTLKVEGGVAAGTLGSSEVLQNGWRGDLYVTSEPNPKAWAGAALATARPDDFGWDFYTPTFRAIDGRIVVSNDPVPSPASYSIAGGGTIAVDEKPFHAASFVTAHENAFTVAPSFAGPVGEVRYHDAMGFAYELRDGAGTLLRQGTADGSVNADFGRRGAYRADVRAANGVQLALTFDTSQPDFNPPVLSSLRITGADGRIAGRVAPGAPATLALSAVDLDRDANGLWQAATPPRTTRASWRTAGQEWQDLALTTTAEDSGTYETLGHLPTGTHYVADLASITAAIEGKIDLRVELEDAAGNTAVSIMENALTVTQKGRAVRK